MTAVWIRFRAELRSRWRAWLALALLVGIAGGVVLALAAGARRTDSAVARYLAATHAADVSVAWFPGITDLDPERVARLPEVAEAARYLHVAFYGRTGAGRLVSSDRLEGLMAADSRYQTAIERQQILSGRALDPNRMEEVVVTSRAVERFGLRIGSTVRLRFWTPEELTRVGELFGGGDMARLNAEFPPQADPDAWGTGPLVTFRVVGIGADITPEAVVSSMYFSLAFYAAYGRTVGHVIENVSVRLERGAADLASYSAGVEHLVAGPPPVFFSQADFSGRVQRSIHLQAQALWLVAIVGALTALLVLAQALARQAALESIEYPSLRALGMMRGQLFALAIAWAALVGIVGGALATALAVALSPLMPIGKAREAEPDSGIALDVLVIGSGAGAVLVLVLLVAALPALRAARTKGAVGAAVLGKRRSTTADLVARAGFPPSAIAGVRMALEPGRGRTAVPVRSTLLGAIVAVASVAVALGFTASFEHLAQTPRLYGQNWDTVAGFFTGSDLGDQLVSDVAAEPLVAGAAAGTTADVAIGGRRAGVLGIDPIKGSVEPVVLEGRAPVAPDEIFLGTRTLRALGVEIGEDVDVTYGETTVAMRIVGRGVLPEIVDNIKELGLGRGAAMTLQGLRRLIPDAGRAFVLVRSVPGTDARAPLADLFYAAHGFAPRKPRKPSDIDNFGGVDSMPYVIMGLFGAVAVAALAHTLVTVIRRRRRDLAILKTLGFTRPQVLAAVGWQATTVAAVALLIGLPLGILAGRWGWNAFAENLGVVPEPVTPIAPILLVIPATILLANLVAALPGRIAARTRPAVVLRAE